MTTEQREAASGERTNGGAVRAPLALPDQDVRRKRPPLVSFLLRVETLRKALRVLSLLALDYVGVVAALFSALMVKLLLIGHPDAGAAWSQTKHWVPFAYLMTVLLFARVDLYTDRTRRPGLARIAGALFQATVIALVFALASGQHFSSYFIFYGSLIFGTAYIATLRELHLRVTGWVLEQAGYRRRALLVGSGRHIEAVAHALADARARASKWSATSRSPRARAMGCARSASSTSCRSCSAASGSRR